MSTLHCIWADDSCRENIQRMDGFLCPKNEEPVVLNRTTREQCVLLGLHKQHQVISHNRLENICSIQSTICPVLAPNEFISILIPKRNPDIRCIHWIPYSGEVPKRSIQDTSERMVIVAARFHRDGFLLPAKYEIGTNLFYSVKNGGEEVASPSSDTELLVVDASCTTMWIAHNTAGNHPFPHGAIEAGYTPDGTVLYFVRMWIQGDAEYSYGYYDINTRYGYNHLFYVQVSKEFHILCIV